MSGPLPAFRLGAALLFLGLASAPGGAAAEGLSFRFEPAYEASDTTSTFPGGAETRTRATALVQRYSLTLDKSLFPALRFGASGIYQWTLGSLDPGNAPPSELDSRQWNLDARLTAGNPTLNGVLYYDQGQRSARSMSGGLTTEAPTLQNDVIGFTGVWRPDGLPDVQLLLTRDRQHDEDRRLSDVVTDAAQLLLHYAPDPRLDFRARLLYSNSEDRLNGLETTAFSEQARASWANDWADRRVSVYANYLLNATQSDTTVTGPGGSIRVQRYPLIGLSTVEALPPAETPTRVTLKPNPQLLDGDTAAGAGLDIGFGVGPGDTAWRDVGAQFADSVTPVSLVYVWVDKPLPAAVAGAFTWVAYRSDDNLNWTAVPLTGPVTFGLFQNFFEIPVQLTQAKYLKVVTRPLAVGVTLDDQYRSILVTEVQFYEAIPAGAGRQISSLAGQVSASTRVQLIRSRLIYDLSVTLQHSNLRSALWNVTNGLRFNQRLSRMLDLSALAERSDGNSGSGGHLAVTRWSGSLAADPLPALGATLTYSGDWSQAGFGQSTTNSVSLSARAMPYRDFNLFGVATHGIATGADGRTQKSDTVTAGVSVVPNPKLAFTGSYVNSFAVHSGGGQPERVSTTWRIEGTASFNPVPALSASGGISYAQIDRVEQTLLNLNGSLSPFPGGNLVLSFRYNQYADSLSSSKSIIFGPYLRWNIRAGMFMEASYTWLDVSLPAQDSMTRVLSVRLTLLI
jgi:hypothetical protein